MKSGIKRSIYWNHFDELPDPTNSGTRRAKCSHCYQVLSISSGCVGNLARHLRNKHPAICMMLQPNQGLGTDDLPDLNDTNLNDTEIEYATEDGQKFKHVYVMSNNSDEEEVHSQEVKPKTKPKKVTPPRPASFSSYERDDRSNIFGRLIGIKMRGLEKTQRLIAEKIINDTMHEAEMGNLNKYCGLSMIQIERLPSTEPESREKDVTSND